MRDAVQFIRSGNGLRLSYALLVHWDPPSALSLAFSLNLPIMSKIPANLCGPQFQSKGPRIKQIGRYFSHTQVQSVHAPRSFRFKSS